MNQAWHIENERPEVSNGAPTSSELHKAASKGAQHTDPGPPYLAGGRGGRGLRSVYPFVWDMGTQPGPPSW